MSPVTKLKTLQAKLEEAKRINQNLKTSSQTIPDPDLQTKIIESHEEIASLEQKIEKLKAPAEVKTAKKKPAKR